jgi:hypothetical protein
MHSGRFACFLLGLWFAGGLFMAFIARQNLDTADRLISDGDTVVLMHSGKAGIESMRGLLHHHALEQTRALNESWETAQIVLGSFLFFFLLFATREDKYSLLAALLMVIVTVAERAVLSPEVTSRGRVIDLLAANAPAADRVKFLLLEKAHLACEIGKAGLGVILGGRLILARRKRPSARDVRQELNLVDKANYRHING